MLTSSQTSAVHGEMADRFREFDWSATPLGPVDRWPESWRHAVNIILDSSFPTALALGTELRLLLNRRLGLAVSGQAFYGPDILTFGSADSLTDLSARVEMNIAPRLTAFGGMRWFEFDLTEGAGKRTLQEEVFVGAGYRF